MIAPGLIPIFEILLAHCADSSTRAGQFLQADAKLFGQAALSTFLARFRESELMTDKGVVAHPEFNKGG